MRGIRNKVKNSAVYILVYYFDSVFPIAFARTPIL